MYPDNSPGHFLLLGGARCGKSSFALELAHKIAPGPGSKRLFLATAKARDEDMARRIYLHQMERGGAFETIEEEIRLGHTLIKEKDRFQVGIIDCITMWVSNIVLECRDRLEEEMSSLEEALKESSFPVILVSNEVGLGIVPENSLAREYRDILGSVNRRLASLCDNVAFIVAGLPVRVKGVSINC